MPCYLDINSGLLWVWFNFLFDLQRSAFFIDDGLRRFKLAHINIQLTAQTLGYTRQAAMWKIIFPQILKQNSTAYLCYRCL